LARKEIAVFLLILRTAAARPVGQRPAVLVRSIGCGIKGRDTWESRSRIREAKAAFLALDDREPKSLFLSCGILGLDERRPIALSAEQAIALFPVDPGNQSAGRRTRVMRKKGHGNEFLFAPFRIRSGNITLEPKLVNLRELPSSTRV
jgi:hypothetical protein